MICLNSILFVFVNPRFHFKNDCKINCVTIIEKSSNYADGLYAKQFQPNKSSFKNNLHVVIHNVCRLCIVHCVCIFHWYLRNFFVLITADIDI